MTRVEIVQATAELLRAELEDPRRLAAALRAELPPDWPPEHHDAFGYSVVPSQQRRGIATAAAKLLTETAFNRGVHAIRANTLAHLEPSIGVLRKLGFEPVPPAEPGVVTFELRRGGRG